LFIPLFQVAAPGPEGLRFLKGAPGLLRLAGLEGTSNPGSGVFKVGNPQFLAFNPGMLRANFPEEAISLGLVGVLGKERRQNGLGLIVTASAAQGLGRRQGSGEGL